MKAVSRPSSHLSAEDRFKCLILELAAHVHEREDGCYENCSAWQAILTGIQNAYGRNFSK